MTPDLVVDQDRGIRAFIIGTGGESTAQPVQIAPNSVVQAGTFGVMKFTLKDGGYDWQFFSIPGQTFTDAGSASCHDAPGGVSGSLSTVTVAYGVFGINSNVVAINPGTGFTEIDEQPSTESTTADLSAEWAVNRPTINATWATKHAGALGVEIKAAP